MRITKLVAVLLSDGSIDEKRNTVSFTESKDIVEKLVREFQQINGLVINWKVDKQKNSYRARAYSKKLVNLLKKHLESFRTRPYNIHPKSTKKPKDKRYPNIKIPNEIIDDKEKLRNFLQYYCTCDGGPIVSVYKRSNRGLIQIDYGIKIGCKNPTLRYQLKRFLKVFNIKANEKPDGLEIGNLKGIKIFSKEIKFLEESKVRRGKLFNGFKKNDVLNLIIFCGNLSSKSFWINKNYKNIDDLKRFLLKKSKK